ncbi:methyl-accepting chemotaxis protein [Ureibacillus sp. GCM10028918]|uniref:methyl-accepting chemotaxis protein n=1 Tax=Ureibacillus sp. GCM10028918 TaxID=3273429 RepID=UPI0036162F4A
MKFLKNLKVVQKLIILITLFALTVLLIAYVSITSLSSTVKSTNTIYKDQLIPSQIFNSINLNNRGITAGLLESMVTEDPEQKGLLSEDLEEDIEEITSLIEQLNSMSLSSEVTQHLDELSSINEKLNVIRNNVNDLASSNDNDEAYRVFSNELEPTRKQFVEVLDSIEQLNTDGAQKSYDEAVSAAEKANTLVILTIILSLLISISLGIFISRLITSPIKKIQTLLGQVENGDLTVKGDYQSKDEIGILTVSFNKMIESVNMVIRTVGNTSGQVAAASEELTAISEQSTRASQHITATTQELVVGAENQVEIIKESSNHIENISQGTQQIVNNTDTVSNTVHEASRLSSEGRKVINEVNTQMEFIDGTVVSLVKSFTELSNRSREIGQIIEVITNISAQTNLLALNAAIEAARAGEHGKGFAVVADEVRKLAEESAHSARQINNLVVAIQEDTNKTMKTVNEATGEVKQGIAVVQIAGNTFGQIEAVIKEAVPQIENIKENVQMLLTGMDNVNSSISLVSEVATETEAGTQTVTSATEEQLASMEEISSSSQSLANLAGDLQTLIMKFKI